LFALRPSAKRLPAGFSLLELIVVLTLLSILTSAIVPVFAGSLESMRRDQAVRELLAVLKFAQERAIADSAEFRVYINEEKGVYWIESLQVAEDGARTFEELGESFTDPWVLPESIEFKKVKARDDRERDLKYISFFPSGACDYVEIELARNDRRTVCIQTKGALGRFEVKETR